MYKIVVVEASTMVHTHPPVEIGTSYSNCCLLISAVVYVFMNLFVGSICLRYSKNSDGIVNGVAKYFPQWVCPPCACTIASISWYMSVYIALKSMMHESCGANASRLSSACSRLTNKCVS